MELKKTDENGGEVIEENFEDFLKNNTIEEWKE